MQILQQWGSSLHTFHPGEQVSMRCPCCEAFVSNAAFHNKDLLTTFLVGEGVLGWPKAHKALKMVRDSLNFSSCCSIGLC